ncbi:hypothetical protein FHR84_000658 [Actinopolyspora biskrensis]|uniref:Uncharacterized protein n=1 Tax=Actinopolyspora biskrensis TaxID=1470178 RepID=A0A852YPZ7_9ACTN|nr:hypothetical protein [Actinopolyspora biskrensis]
MKLAVERVTGVVFVEVVLDEVGCRSKSISVSSYRKFLPGPLPIRSGSVPFSLPGYETQSPCWGHQGRTPP